MRIAYIALVLAGLCSLASTFPQGESAREGDCKFTDGKASWRASCNWCRCSEKGFSMCSRKGCSPALEARLQERGEKECEGNAQWKRDCNWCNCANGKAICTAVHCGSDPQTPTTSDKFEIASGRGLSRSLAKENTCESLSEEGSWKNDCNWCKCSNGLSHCTRKFCRPGLEVKDAGSSECSGDIRWKKDCNWCECVAGVAVCSANSCKRDSAVNTSCIAGPEGGRWKQECNWCQCTETGIGRCTKRGCLVKQDQNELVRGNPDCEGDVTFKNGCNWCRCVNGESICTSNPCEDRQAATESEKCQHGQSWADDCNTCFCNNGNSFCTLRACIRGFPHRIQPATLRQAAIELSKTDSKSFECKEGSRWRKDCNWCSCVDGVGTCTLRACLPGALAKEVGPSCKEGSRWKEDCNFCSCGNGQAICTKKFCPVIPVDSVASPALFKTGVPRVASTSAIAKDQEKPTCTRGSRWRKLCNWCTCTNGIGICEQRACLSDSAKELDGTCEGDSRWKVDCNWCTCVEGKGQCTERLCGPEAGDTQHSPTTLVGSEKEVQCIEGSRWGSNCNWCTCSNGIGTCTLRACLPGSEGALEGKCEGESKWLKDCNWCHCIEGKSVCTQKACAPPSDTAGESVPSDDASCSPGNSWTEECNVCVCINGLTVCTKQACPQPEIRTDQCVAEEGETWKDNCNSCRCINGLKACTKKVCRPSADVQLPEICSLPPIQPDAQLCGGFETKWTYSTESGHCEEVVYGGCGGTENLFSNEQECQTTCGVQQSLSGKAVKPMASPNPKERCFMPIESGPCFALISRFAFSTERNRCEEFFYGGCQGNQNNFPSVDECFNVCGGNPPTVGKYKGDQ